MKIHILSDLHIEFADYHVQVRQADLIILAGDIHIGDKGVKWIQQHIKDTPVLYILGNHEYYGNTYPKLLYELKKLVAGSQIHIMENDILSIDGVNFYGCTLWTDFELFGNPQVAGYHCQQWMNDYKRIRRLPGYSKLRSLDTATIHRQSLQWLSDTLAVHAGETNIIISHHGPGIESLKEERKADLISTGYVSDLTKFIETLKPDYWIHGHIHKSSDYSIHHCRVLCNPRGYPDKPNKEFNPQLLIEIESNF